MANEVLTAVSSAADVTSHAAYVIMLAMFLSVTSLNQLGETMWTNQNTPRGNKMVSRRLLQLMKKGLATK